MRKQPNIRQLYKPVQPAVMSPNDGVSYTELLPDYRLQNLIYFYWEFRTVKELDAPFEYKVVPNGCIDIYFEINNPQQNYVTGLSKQHSELMLPQSFRYIGICFMPAVFTQLYHIKASELSNRFEDLADVVPKTSRFITDHCLPILQTSEVKSLLDHHFLKLFYSTDIQYDSRLSEAVQIIMRNSGNLNIEKDLNTGASPRHLRRLFEFYIGDTPKTFSKIVRFQKVIQTHWANKEPAVGKYDFNNEYYDQAHFIREFKNFYGKTPGKAF